MQFQMDVYDRTSGCEENSLAQSFLVPQECDPYYSANKTFLPTAVYQKKFISQYPKFQNNINTKLK